MTVDSREFDYEAKDGTLVSLNDDTKVFIRKGGQDIEIPCWTTLIRVKSSVGKTPCLHVVVFVPKNLTAINEVTPLPRSDLKNFERVITEAVTARFDTARTKFVKEGSLAYWILKRKKAERDAKQYKEREEYIRERGMIRGFYLLDVRTGTDGIVTVNLGYDHYITYQKGERTLQLFSDSYLLSHVMLATNVHIDDSLFWQTPDGQIQLEEDDISEIQDDISAVLELCESKAFFEETNTRYRARLRDQLKELPQ